MLSMLEAWDSLHESCYYFSLGGESNILRVTQTSQLI